MIETVNLIGKLPVHPTRKWNKRNIEDVKGIIVHQAICKDCSTYGIAKYHIKPGPQNHISGRGAPGICYHWTIDYDGIIYRCNEFEDVVWHAGNRKINYESFGICVLGDFDGPEYFGKDGSPTDEQETSLKFLLRDLTNSFSLEYVKGHFEVKKNKVNCPGLDLTKLIVDFRGK